MLATVANLYYIFSRTSYPPQRRCQRVLFSLPLQALQSGLHRRQH